MTDVFKEQFGLESNAAPVHEAPAQAPAVEDGTPAPAAKPATPEAQASSIESITNAIEELGKTGDNLERVQTQRAQREAEQAAGTAVAEADGGEQVIAEDVAEQVKAESEAAKAGEPEGGEDDGAAALDVPTAQEYIDYLDTNFGDQVLVPFNANGKTQSVTLAKLKEMAAGYSGEAAVSRRLQEANDTLRQAKAKEAESTAPKQQLDAILSHLEDPTKLVRDLIIGSYDGDVGAYLTSLRDVVTAELERITENPQAFENARQMRNLDRKITSIERAVSGERAPATETRQAAPATAPADFGFQAGIGYADAHKHEVARALEVAVKAAGKPVDYADEVIEKWNAGGRKTQVTDMLLNMLEAERTDAPKLDAAKKPPVRKQPPVRGLPTAQSTAKKPTGRVAWGDIEKIVANEVRGAQRSGKV